MRNKLLRLSLMVYIFQSIVILSWSESFVMLLGLYIWAVFIRKVTDQCSYREFVTKTNYALVRKFHPISPASNNNFTFITAATVRLSRNSPRITIS